MDIEKLREQWEVYTAASSQRTSKETQAMIYSVYT